MTKMAHWAGNSSLTGSGQGIQATASQLEEVLKAARRTPIIDNHAHPLLKPDSLSRYPLLSITTEASGDAIDAAYSSLSHLRAIRQLSSILGCNPTWEAVVGAIEERRIESMDDWVAECFTGIETILIDDGLDSEEDVYEYSWHDSFTRSRCKRIVRIESVAAKLVNEQVAQTSDISDMPEDMLFEAFLQAFGAEITQAIEDPEVVGFKSVICYRTGLDIAKTVDNHGAGKALAELWRICQAEHKPARIQQKALNDFLVHHTADLMERSGQRRKPMQFHVGLGDADITLTKASPAHMQDFIRAHPLLPIVLLHASYPYTREAGYLATVYPNVYADIGEVFPFISRDGQESVVRQILELCPWSKILWSTDGHWFPETYILAILQVREVLGSVLCESVRKGQLGWRAAVELIRAVLFVNSNKLYHLGLAFEPLEGDEFSDSNAASSDLELFQAFLGDDGRGRPAFIRISWVDYTAMTRMRMIPYRKFITNLQERKSPDIGITKACLGVLQTDVVVAGSATGEYRVHPDFSSLKHGPMDGQVNMYADFREKDGSDVALCPRSLLHRAVAAATAQDLRILVGFEIEFVLMDRREPSQESPSKYTVINNDGHAWSTTQYSADPRVHTLLSDMVSELEREGIYVEQIHPEVAPGQFELILPPYEPVEACDTLLHTKEVMSALASAAGFRMTLHPKPFANVCGTGAHTHFSVASKSTGKSDVANYETFYAGILKHLRGILAFTLSSPVSYQRLGDGLWAGGSWVAWGTQNRETALRKIEDSHW
jgi:glutamine synthetase/predicted TIM-barrel fold metal-dependent hydrolase